MTRFQCTVIDAAIAEVRGKLIERLAEKGWGTFASSHETLGIIAEEYDELLEAVRGNDLMEVDAELKDLAVAAILGMASITANRSEQCLDSHKS